MGRRSEHSRDQIAGMALEAASRLVQAHGLSGLSARRIAAEIGYTPGTLYLVFRNLDELILHLNGTTLDALFQRLETAHGETRKSPVFRTGFNSVISLNKGNYVIN